MTAWHARCEISVPELVAQLQALGVARGDVVLVHTSFRAVRPVAGGPAGLIAALGAAVGPEGTIAMPSWTGDDDAVFDPVSTPVAEDLGVVAETFRLLPGVKRGRHAFAFSARGPKATEILADDLVLPPHQHESPVGRVLEADGKVLLLGVDHDASTMLHLAELLADVPYRRPKHITVSRDGRPTRIDYLENDHCCALFRLANAWLTERGLQAEGPVGYAPAKLMRARDVVDTVVPTLTANPFAFLHPRRSSCTECAETWRSMPE